MWEVTWIHGMQYMCVVYRHVLGVKCVFLQQRFVRNYSEITLEILSEGKVYIQLKTVIITVLLW